MKNILVLCTGNSCRSQIAHAYFDQLTDPQKVNTYSAGIETHGLNPMAVEVLLDDGIDISHHSSNHIDEYANIDFDYVITVCDHAKEVCPYVPSRAQQFHHNFTDPAKATGNAEQIWNVFKSVRDDIKQFVTQFIEQHQLNA